MQDCEHTNIIQIAQGIERCEDCLMEFQNDIHEEMSDQQYEEELRNAREGNEYFI